MVGESFTIVKCREPRSRGIFKWWNTTAALEEKVKWFLGPGQKQLTV